MIFYWFFSLQSILYCTPKWVTAYKVCRFRFSASPPWKISCKIKKEKNRKREREAGVSKFLCFGYKVSFTCCQIALLRTHTLVWQMSEGFSVFWMYWSWNTHSVPPSERGDLFRESAVSRRVAAELVFLVSDESIAHLREPPAVAQTFVLRFWFVW